MRARGFANGHRERLWMLGLVLGAAACSPKAGSADATPAPITDAGHARGGHKDAMTLLPGIKGPPDAMILHPGEGGIRAKALGSATKIDLVFMVDDSISMGDKHEVLKAAIPDLLNRFVNPVCIDKYGRTTQPALTTSLCPADMNRQFAPVRDMHIGVITSSLGSADSMHPVCSPIIGGAGNDGAHFAGTLKRAASVPTSANGFLVWDPDQKASPPGQSDVSALVDSFRNLIDVVGQSGCGLESQLEAWYRLLVDPEPPAGKQPPCPNDAATCGAPSDGVDHVLLAQRAAFLRPDSLLVLIMLTDENDCSMSETWQKYLGDTSILLPRGSAACATNPGDPCCYSCMASPPAGCPNPDPVCMTNPTLMHGEDQANLRCFDNKRRFGFDGLQPVQRYIDALTKAMIPSRSGAMVQNPLFAGGQRTPADLFVVGIIGVPWQDVATDDTLKSTSTLSLKSARQLRDGKVWDVILGDPGTRTPPTNALMLESVTPRMGKDPVTGDAVAPPSAGVLANPINGHERNIAALDDLQYSCIFALPQPRTCNGSSGGCECYDPTDGTMNPVCQDPSGAYTSTQRFAKAYPASRVLQVLRGVGDSGVIASICPRNITNPSSEDYGYRPVIGTLIEDVAPKLIR